MTGKEEWKKKMLEFFPDEEKCLDKYLELLAVRLIACIQVSRAIALKFIFVLQNTNDPLTVGCVVFKIVPPLAA